MTIKEIENEIKINDRAIKTINKTTGIILETLDRLVDRVQAVEERLNNTEKTKEIQ